MKSGKGFGELALSKERLMPRAATIRCITECHLGVMSKADYTKVL
jgi:CRP-like cAMP-binding protein